MKPNWNDAPDWAQWMAMDENGEWWWYEIRPNDHSGEWYCDGKMERATELNPCWEGTLEERPQ